MTNELLRGVFMHRDPEEAPKCADDPPVPRPSFMLRFFEDGTVVSANVLTDDPARDWAAIGSWFHERHCDRGAYRIAGDVISFTIASRAGTVDYFGVVRPGSIQLSWRSNINGTIRNALEYRRLDAVV